MLIPLRSHPFVCKFDFRNRSSCSTNSVEMRTSTTKAYGFTFLKILWNVLSQDTNNLWIREICWWIQHRIGDQHLSFFFEVDSILFVFSYRGKGRKKTRKIDRDLHWNDFLIKYDCWINDWFVTTLECGNLRSAVFVIHTKSQQFFRT